MTTLDELEKLADAATQGPWRKTGHGVVIADRRTGNTDDDYIVMWDDTPDYVETDATFIAAANPQTIKQLIALVRLQHEALMSCSMGCSYDETEVVAATKAYEEFNK